MNRNSIFVVTLLGALAFGPVPAPSAFGQPPPTGAAPERLSLETAIRFALEANPELRVAAARARAATGRAQQRQTWANPDLELSVEDWSTSRGGYSEAKKLVGLSQPVPLPGRKRLDRDIGAADVRAAAAELDQRRREVVRETRAAFYQVLGAGRLVEVATELVKFAESAADTARKRVAAGGAADQEQLRAEILVEQTRADLAGCERDLASARQSLAGAIGRADLSDLPLDGALAESADLVPLEQGPERWLQTHPTLLAARANRERMELELRRSRLAAYADPRLGVAAGRAGNASGSILQVGVSLPLPLFDRGQGHRAEATANLAAAEAEATAVEQRLRRDWLKAGRQLRTVAAQVAAYRDRILPRADTALSLVRTGFEQGKFSLVDLLDTQRTAAEVRRTYHQKLVELNIAWAEMDTLLSPAPLTPTAE